jgi:hypothetical protein
MLNLLFLWLVSYIRRESGISLTYHKIKFYHHRLIFRWISALRVLPMVAFKLVGSTRSKAVNERLAFFSKNLWELTRSNTLDLKEHIGATKCGHCFNRNNPRHSQANAIAILPMIRGTEWLSLLLFNHNGGGYWKGQSKGLDWKKTVLCIG